MKIADIMSRNLKTVSPDDSIQKAATIMNKNHIGGLIVESGIMLAGIITERDILQAFAKNLPAETPVRDVMTGYVVTVQPSDRIEVAAQKMVKNHIKRLPVVENKQCVGIVTATDLLTSEGTMLAALHPLLVRKREMLEKGKKKKKSIRAV